MADFDFSQFATIASLMSGNKDQGALFPASDAQDVRDGATHIPGEVTDARRRGETVIYNRADKEWTLPDGTVVT